MSEIKRVIVTLKPPKGDYPGHNAEGHYVIDGDMLTMTGPSGNIAQDGTGKKYQHKLRPGDDEVGIAGKLTLELRKAFRGHSAAPTGFNGKINYFNRGKI